MTTIGHVMILASAGSGKTYALTNRFVRLLALGAAPERIVALTFTRKAAGEFFDEILKKLARAAQHPAYARQLADEIGCAQRPPDFLKLLRAVADAMHRLRLGTFDGFFARIAQNFPLELGLTGKFEILEEHAGRMERQRVLRRMFERTGALDQAQREFIEAFKRATFGGEEKRLGAQLDAFLDDHQEVYLGAPFRDAWGNPQRIWREGTRWLDPASDLEAAVRTLREWIETAAIADRQRARWREFLDAWAGWTPGAVPTRALIYVLEKSLDAWPDLTAGRAVLEFDRKKQELGADACAALAAMVRHVVGGELARRLEITCGIHAVLEAYDAVYHDTVRRTGKLTFGDVQRLLLPGEDTPVLSTSAGDDRRLLIDYRLDGEIDHWLLDEFQDTSFGQWSVLRNLIDEAVQDPSGARSFFYVGDVKQAIFVWRAGDPRLFREIFDHYNALQPRTITEEHLVKSWRSGPAVIMTVNRVFGAAPVLSELFPGEASRAWNREWRPHETAKPELDGQVAMLLTPGGSNRDDDEAARFRIVAQLIEEIQPLQRGLSCALLVQKNSTANSLADYLRREGGWPAVAESDLHVCTDNPLGSALLAAAKVAAHPGDSLSWQHVLMTPLREVFAAEGLIAPEQVTRRLLGEFHSGGFERTMSAWVRRLEPTLMPDDTFSRERARQFTAAAGLFDATGSREIAEFVAFMERHTVRDAESVDVLRVMTIHKAKGLGFDLVILPDLEGQKLDCRRDGLAVQRAPDRSVEWVLDLPTKLFCGCDQVLGRHVTAAESDACYEALSLLYVAMTRAKRAMYLVAKSPGTSTSRNFPKLLASTLGEETLPVRVGSREFSGAYAEGNANWHQTLGPADAGRDVEPQVNRGLVPIAVAPSLRALRLPGRRPSAAKAADVSAAQLFSGERSASASFGTAVHALLAEVEWGGPQTVRRLAAAWAERGVPPEVIEEAMGCLNEPQAASVWRRVNDAEVWRERAFEVVLDGMWITGVFDRVVIERAANGRPARARVFDFKTDRGRGDLGPVVQRHAPQLELYRRAAALLLGLPEQAVESQLVFTRLRQVVRMPAVVG